MHDILPGGLVPGTWMLALLACAWLCSFGESSAASFAPAETHLSAQLMRDITDGTSTALDIDAYLALVRNPTLDSNMPSGGQEPSGAAADVQSDQDDLPEAAEATDPSQTDNFDETNLVHISDSITPVSYLQLANLISILRPDAASMKYLLEAATADEAFAISVLLTEGQLEGGRDDETSAKFLQKSADEGTTVAALRRAQILQNSIDAVTSKDDILRLYQVAAKDQPLAALALGQLYDKGLIVPQNLDQADIWYNLAISLTNTDETRTLLVFNGRPQWGEFGQTDGTDILARDYQKSNWARLMRIPLLTGSHYLSTAKGRSLLASLSNQSPSFALEIADLYSCVECGGTIDLQQSADYYRSAARFGNVIAKLRLAQLLSSGRVLAEANDDKALSSENISSYGSSRWSGELAYIAYLRAFVGSSAPSLLDAACSDNTKISSCIRVSYEIALGRATPQLIERAFANLQRIAHDSSLSNEDGLLDQAKLALMDVLTFYGDYKAARAELSAVTDDALGENDQYVQYRKVLMLSAFPDKWSSNPEPNRDAFALVEALARKGDESSALLSQALYQSKLTPGELFEGSSAIGVGEATEYLSEISASGTSLRHVDALRRLSSAWLAAENRPKALDFELSALSTDLQLTEILQITEGRMSADLARACKYAASSRRVSALGYGEMAVLLAKEAVNHVQSARRAMSGVPEQLQACFLTARADHYRWLTALLVKYDRTEEASEIAERIPLDDTFRFSGQSRRFEASALQDVSFNSVETHLRPLIRSAGRLNIGQAAARRYELATRETLTLAEKDESAALTARIAASEAETQASLTKIRELLTSSSAPASVRFPAEPQVVNRLRTEVARQSVSGHAVVALQFIVLPDAMISIITTGGAVTSYTWDGSGRDPFSEEKLNRLVDNLIVSLSSPTYDYEESASEMFDLVLGPIWEDIKHADVLLISGDKRLQFIPFAALRWEGYFLGERFQISDLSGASLVSLGDSTGAMEVSAFGSTKGAFGLPALPAVRDELFAIVKDKIVSPAGLIDGTIRIDDQFSKNSLARGMLFDEHRRGMVHISSHFSIGKNVTSSFLVSGDGKKISMEDFEVGGVAGFDFSRVDLITFSACQTGIYQEEDNGSVVSLAQIVQDLGAHAVVSTLWTVNDETTALFMRHFYSEVSRGIGYGAALANSQRKFIHDADDVDLLDSPDGVDADLTSKSRKLSHPYYWAGYRLSGAWR